MPAVGSGEAGAAPRSAGPRAGRAIVRVGAVAGLASLVALGAGRVPALDLASHFRVQYLAGLLPGIALALALRMRAPALLMALVALVHAGEVVRAAWPAPSAHASSVSGEVAPGGVTSGEVSGETLTVRVATVNLLATAADHGAAIAALRRLDPDVVVFQEYTPAWHRALSGALDGLPHRHAVPIDGPFGIALYSRAPIVRRDAIALDRVAVPTLEALIEIEGARFGILGTHPPPPLGATLLASNARHLRALGARAAAREGPLVVAGDLNATPWSAAFRALVEGSGLVDARRGHGILATWSPLAGDSLAARLARSPLTSLPIDHVLVGGGATVGHAFVGEAAGSDHRAFVADVRVPRDPRPPPSRTER